MGQRLRVNYAIRARKVRLIFDGHNMGIVEFANAIQLASDRGLDLVEVSPNADPPVCHVMDYGKYQYEQKKKSKQHRHKASEGKIIRLTPAIADHDLEIKIKQIKAFLTDGKRVMVIVRIKKRHGAELGRQVLNKLLEAVAGECKVDQNPKMDGGNLLVNLMPKS